MRTAGIIAEYNPFHNGHAHQISRVRALGFDAVVCVMSPGVVQRGSLALMPAQVRAEAALSCGADVVLCLPAPHAAASAEAFAAAGVRALSALGCVQALCYGAETPDAAAHMRAAKALLGPAFAGICAKGLPGACPLPPRGRGAAQAVCGEAGGLLASPNDILGVEYCKAILMQKAHCSRWRWRAGRAHGAPLGGAQAGAAAPAQQTFFKPARRAAGCGVCQRHGPASPCGAAWPGRAGALCAPEGAGAVPARSGRGRCWTKKKAFPRPFYAACARAAHRALLMRRRGRRAGKPSGDCGAAGVHGRRAAGAFENEALMLRRACAVLRWMRRWGCLRPALAAFTCMCWGRARRAFAVLRKAKRTASLPLSASLAVLEKASPPAAQAAALHAAAEDFAALCLASPRPMGTAYTQKFISPQKG